MSLAVYPAPLNVGYSQKKKPTFKTIVKTPPSGREVTRFQPTYPMWEFELTYEVLRDETQNYTPFPNVKTFTELRQLAEFWLSMNGQYGAFLYTDLDDCSRTGQLINTGDGSTMDFVMVRTWAFGVYSFTEPVGAVNLSAPITIKLNGVAQDPASYTIPVDGNTITFTAPPGNGVVITADFSFYFYCRFIEDSLDLEEFYHGYWLVKSVKFRSTKPDPPAGSGMDVNPACIGTFEYVNTYLRDVGANEFNLPGIELDKFGQYYIASNAGLAIYNPAGSIVSLMTNTDLANGVDAWFGSAIVGRGTGFQPTIGVDATPIMHGQYLLAYMTGSMPVSFSRWWVLLQPQSTGFPTVIGAVWYDSFFGPPRSNYWIATISNNGGLTDPLLMRSSFNASGDDFGIVVLPSVQEYIDNAYKAGWAGGMLGHAPAQVPLTLYTHIATNNLSKKLMIDTFGSNKNLKSGWSMPSAAGGTNYYIYFNRGYMDFCALGGSNANPEVTTVLQPAYPNGCVIKIDMGILNYFAAATYAAAHGDNLGITPMYTVDNANWVDSGGGVQVPFTDEYTYLSNSAVGGNDIYQMEPYAVVPQDDGTWWVLMGMAGLTDAFVNTAGTVRVSLRVFSYAPLTQKLTQIIRHICILYAPPNIPQFGTHSNDDFGTLAQILGRAIYINGFLLDAINSGKAYRVKFMSF